MHLQSHLGSQRKPILPILLCVHHFACLLAQQLDLTCLAAIPTNKFYFTSHQLCPKTYLKAPPKEPHLPPPWLGADAKISSLSTISLNPSQCWLTALKRRGIFYFLNHSNCYIFFSPTLIITLKNLQWGWRWKMTAREVLCVQRKKDISMSSLTNALLCELFLPPQDGGCFCTLSLWVFVCFAK